jgi:hypothetical protein
LHRRQITPAGAAKYQLLVEMAASAGWVGNARKRVASQDEIQAAFKNYIFYWIDTNYTSNMTLADVAKEVSEAYHKSYQNELSGKNTQFKNGFRTRFAASGGEDKLNLFDQSRFMLDIINHFNEVSLQRRAKAAVNAAMAAATRKGGRRRRKATRRRRS